MTHSPASSHSKFSSLTLAAALAITACASDPNTGPDDGADASPGLDAAPEIDAAPEPTPAFTVRGQFSGQVAVDASGIRPTFTADGTQALSIVRLSLTEEGADESCSITMAPSFVEFATASTSNRFFATIVIAPGASGILQDNCGWDDTHMLAELAALGNIEVGLTQARFPEDRPSLDVFFDRTWPLPNSTANITVVAGGAGWAMDASGVVDTATLVEPTGGTFIDGLYQF